MKDTIIPLAKSPDAWRRTAIGLKRSADIIWGQWFEIFSRLDGGSKATVTPQEIGDLALLPTFLLLSGLAIENALKGLLIAKDKEIVDSVVKWKIKSGGHDLCELYKQTDLSFTTDQKELLDAMTQAVLWAGRYPVPKKHFNKLDFPIFLGPYFQKLDIDSIVENFSKLKKGCENLYLSVLDRYPENTT